MGAWEAGKRPAIDLAVDCAAPVEDRSKPPPECGDGLTVYFDGSCPLCQREIALAKKLTGETSVTYADISSRAPDDMAAPDLSVGDAMRDFMCAAPTANWRAAPRRFWRCGPHRRSYGS